MDFDIAGLLSNPDVLYMLAGAGKALSAQSGNATGAAVGDMTQQGITAQNQMKFIQALLGKGGGTKAGETVGSGFDKIQKQFLDAHDLTKVSSDGKTATFTGPPSAFESLSGRGGIAPTAPQAPMQTSALTPQVGGQPGILNPSVGLPGDLSGLSLAGLKPEDINKAITLGLTGADLERKKVSDLYQNQYWQELIKEKALARGAKDVSAPVGGGLTLAQYNSYPSDVKAHLYVNYLRGQSGQSPMSFEQFKQQTDTNSTMQLIDRANSDSKFNEKLMEYRKAGAMNFNEAGARQEQHEIIKNWADIGTPKHIASLIPTKEERRSIEKQVEAKTVGKSNDEYEKMLGNALEEHRLRRYEQNIIRAKGKKVSGPKWDAKRNVYVWKFISPLGKEEEKTLEK